ncbi:alpha/beta fold hydrolase [Uliginosibacterium sp. H3]|uniref:Alpha/beta fold hydrolase n=1 Tax=Uliginosibacterium silvisoli TaxID=3114758 RepID=A0ABU6JYQ5_9RHOO|nr:alpha/beta fold hydrolase [Uliginosibacterium sp. H3]
MSQKPEELLPLVLLPGLVCDARMWAPQVAGLADIASTSVGDLSVADNMEALAASVLQRAPAGSFALAGLSMGGYVALEIMRQAPERVLGLALLDTTARPDTPESTGNRHKAMARAENDFTGVLTDLLPKLIHPDQLHDKSITDVHMQMGADAGKDVFKRQQTAIIGRIDSRPTLSRIRCPTLVLCGREDLITPVEVHEEMAAGIRGSTLQLIARCGHLSTLGRPADVTAAMRRWLSSLPAAD